MQVGVNIQYTCIETIRMNNSSITMSPSAT